MTPPKADLSPPRLDHRPSFDDKRAFTTKRAGGGLDFQGVGKEEVLDEIRKS